MYLIILKFRFKIDFLLCILLLETIAHHSFLTWKILPNYIVKAGNILMCDVYTTTCNSSLQQMQLLCTTAPDISKVLPVLLQRHFFPLICKKGSHLWLPLFCFLPTDFRKLSPVFEGLAFISWETVDAVH